MKIGWRKYLSDLLFALPWAFMLSCGVNLQQNGYRQHDDFLNILGVVWIAVALVGFKRSGIFADLLAEPRQEGLKR